jgi:hypothetical protein
MAKMVFFPSWAHYFTIVSVGGMQFFCSAGEQRLKTG